MLNQERWEEVAQKKLDEGSHKSLEDGACIMEMVSYIANEPWSDHPQCACPLLTEYAIRINDGFNDEHRQLLKPLIPLLVGSRTENGDVIIARKRVIRWRNVTVTYPLILDALKLPEMAAKMRTFENTLLSMAEAKALLSEKREELRAANADTYADSKSNAKSNAYANADANAYADAYADSKSYANAYAAANANANAYANAYAYAYAYADASKFRADIAATAVETLRLAAELAVT